MIRVGYDGTIFGTQRVGGVSTYSWEILRRLAVEPGLTVTLSLPARVISDRAAAIAGLSSEKRRQHIPAKIARFLPINLGGDVVHSTYYRVPILPRTKYVTTVHDFVHERYRSGMPRLVHSRQKFQACLRADAIICVSANTRSDLLATYRQIDPERVVVVHHGVDHTTFFPPRSANPSLLDTVVYVGDRKRYKRFDLAVKAAAAAGKTLAVVGDVPDDEDRTLLDSHLRDRWRALGRLTDIQLRDVYAGAYALLYPSDYEGFGLPVLEAQASGCPVVLSNRSSLPEVGGVAALYAEAQTEDAYASCLARLEDHELRRELIAKGHTNAARFTWERATELTIKAYLQALDAPI